MNWLHRLRFWVRRPSLQRELAEEMRAHRDQIEEQFRAEGMSPADARIAARRRFGSDLLQAEESRDEWGFSWLDSLSRDLRFAARLLLHYRTLTAAAVLTLALGVGTNTAVVSVLRTMLLNPLGLRAADPVMVATVRLENLNMRRAETSGAEFRDLGGMSDVFDSVAAMEGRYWTSAAGGEPVRLRGRAVTSDFFRVFAESPAAGRFFSPDDRNSVVLSHAMWQAQYGSDPQAISRAIDLDGTVYRIVGVAAPGFRYPVNAQLWTSLVIPPERLSRRGYNMNLTLLARLKDGVTPEQASQRVDSFVDSFKSPESGYFIDLTPFAHHVAGDLRQPLWILWAAALLVLLTACANIATLLLSRASGRSREIAIRLSLGATPTQVVRQLFVESLLLGAVGGVGGVGVATAAISFLNRLALPGREVLSLVQLDQPLIAYGIALSLASGLVFGIAPALQLLRHSQTSAMARATRRPFQGAFVAAEVAAAMVLLIGAGLLLRTLWSIGRVDPGFDTGNVSTAFLLKPKNDATFIESLDATLASLPGIQSAATAYPIPFSGGGLTSGFQIEGRERQLGESEWHGEAYFVSPTYFETLKIPLLRGRVFSEFDSANAPIVCIIDSKLAEHFFPGQDPLGKEIGMYRGWARVVGVVRSIRATSIDAESRPVVYYPLVQVPYFSSAAVLIRAEGSASGLIRQAVRSANSSVAIYDERSMNSRLEESLGVRRVMAILVVLFAGICLSLAAVGLNGVLSQLVGDRTPEIGIRMALGARPIQVLLHFLRFGLVWGGAGAATGLLAALYAQRWLRDYLFGVQPFDPATFAAAALGVMLIVLAAVWWPAWRASRIAPQSVLRHE